MAHVTTLNAPVGSRTRKEEKNEGSHSSSSLRFLYGRTVVPTSVHPPAASAPPFLPRRGSDRRETGTGGRLSGCRTGGSGPGRPGPTPSPGLEGLKGPSAQPHPGESVERGGVKGEEEKAEGKKRPQNPHISLPFLLHLLLFIRSSSPFPPPPIYLSPSAMENPHEEGKEQPFIH